MALVSPAACAAAAAAGFPDAEVSTPSGNVPLGEFLLAVGVNESHLDPTAQGDTPDELSAAGYAIPPANMTCPQGSATGSSAWGWLQINWSHHAYLARVSGGSTPCAWAQWLYDPANTVAAALALIGVKTAYKYTELVGPNSAWQADAATWAANLIVVEPYWEAAVDDLTAAGSHPGSHIIYPPVSAVADVAGVAAGSAVLTAGILGVLRLTGHLRGRRERRQWPWHL